MFSVRPLVAQEIGLQVQAREGVSNATHVERS
jgi:hypothetical protein